MAFIRRWKRNLLVYALLLLWTTWPILSVLLAFGLTWAGGSTVDEGGVHPCYIFGVDFGETVYTLFVLGWFGMFTLPTGGIGLAAYTIFAIVEWMIARRISRNVSDA